MRVMLMFLQKLIKATIPYANAMKKRASEDICSEEDFHMILELERERADRKSHKFSLVILDTKKLSGNNEEIRNIIKNIIGRVRKIDQIGWYGSERIGIILPYTPFEGACELIENICNSSSVPMLESAYAIHIYPTEHVEFKNGK